MNFRRSALAVLTAALMLFSANAWAGNGQNLLQHTPSSSSIIVSVNLEQLRASPIYQMIWGMMASNAEVQEVLTQMQTQAGFDPNTDLSTMLVALGGDDEKFAILVEGNFNVEQITAFFGTLGEEMATTQYAGHTVYHDPSETGADKAYFSFVNNNLLAVGTQDELGAVLDVVAGTGTALAANEQLNSLCTATDMAGVFWFAGIMTPTMQADLVGSPMAGMTTVRGDGNLTGGLNVAYYLGTSTADEATAMSTFLQAGIAQARTQPEVAQMGLTGLLDAVTVASADNEVSINVAVPEQTLNQLMGMLTAIMAAEGMGQ